MCRYALDGSGKPTCTKSRAATAPRIYIATFTQAPRLISLHHATFVYETPMNQTHYRHTDSYATDDPSSGDWRNLHDPLLQTGNVGIPANASRVCSSRLYRRHNPRKSKIRYCHEESNDSSFIDLWRRVIDDE